MALIPSKESKFAILESVKERTKIQDYIKEVDPRKIISISDLEIKDFQGLPLESEEKQALKKFHEARIKKLNKKKDTESLFHQEFEYYRAVSNLVDYRDILSEKIPI